MKKLLLLAVLLPVYSCTTSVADNRLVARIKQHIPMFRHKPEADRVIERYAQTERQAIRATQAVDSTLEIKVEATAYRMEILRSRIRALTKENEDLKTRVFDLETIAENCDNVIDLRKSVDSIRTSTLKPLYGKR